MDFPSPPSRYDLQFWRAAAEAIHLHQAVAQAHRLRRPPWEGEPRAEAMGVFRGMGMGMGIIMYTFPWELGIYL